MLEEQSKKLTKKEAQEQLVFHKMLKQLVEKKRMLADIEYFIENYVYIENKEGASNDDRSILFKMFPEQKRVLREIEENKNNAIIKARQLGITWLVIAIGVHGCMKLKQFTVAFASQTEDYMKEAINRVEYILQRFPKWLMMEYNKNTVGFNSLFLYEKKADEIIIYHPSTKEGVREESRFKGIISTEKAGRSITGDLIILDEWAYHESAEEVFGAIYPIINRPTSGKFIGLSTNKRGSYFEEIIRGCIDGENTAFNLIFLNAFADPRRDAKWYENTKAILKNTWRQEYPMTIEDALSAGNLTAFPEFSASIHVCEPFDIPSHWIKWAAVDNGLNDPFCWFKAAVDEDGTTYVYYEYSRDKQKDPQVYYSDQAKTFMESCTIEITDEVKEEIDSYDLGYEINGKYYAKEKLQYVIFGLDAFSKDTAKGTGKSLLDRYKEGGGFDYPAVRAVTDRKLGKDTIHEYLKPYYSEHLERQTAKLQIFDTCKFLIKHIPMLTVESDNPTVIAGNSNIDNTADALKYLLIGSPRNNARPVEKEESPLKTYKEKMYKNSKKTRGRMKKGIIN